jgi:hypothetical protein
MAIWGLVHIVAGLTIDHQFAMIHIPFGLFLVAVSLVKG